MAKHKHDSNNNQVGTANDNLVFNTRIYHLQFFDERIKEYGFNMIVENFQNQADVDGWDFGLFEEIFEFRTDAEVAIQSSNDFTEHFNGDKVPVITTKG